MKKGAKMKTEKDKEYIEKVKKYCEEQLQDCIQWHDSPRQAIDRCYGVIMFAINHLLTDYEEPLGNWWDDVMRPKFENLY
jgi:hypothetical protein